MSAIAKRAGAADDASRQLAYMLPSVRLHGVGNGPDLAPREGYLTLDLGASPQDFADAEKIEGVVALEALLTVREAAGECAPGEKLKTILPRAAKELGLLHKKGGLRRVRAAWEGSAGSWKAATFLDFLHRREAMRGRRQKKAREELAALVLTAEAIGSRERQENAAPSENRGLDLDRVRSLLLASGFVGGPVPLPDA